MMSLRSSALTRIAAPVFRGLIFRKYRASAPSAARAEARVRALFARLGDTLADGGYLVGGRFTLADLTLAALASLLFMPTEHPIALGTARRPPPGLAAFRDELAATRVGRHVLRMYREQRRAAPSPTAS